MSIRFSGGERFQRGRGIGGLLRLAEGLFKPAIQTIGKAVKYNTGKAIGRALKNQAIETATNLATNVLSGNSIKEGVERGVNNIKGRGVLVLQQLGEDNNNNCRELKRKTKKVENSKSKKVVNNKSKGKKKTTVTNKKAKGFKWFDNNESV